MSDSRFVAHIDVLGMSSIVERDANLAWSVLSDLVAVLDKTTKYTLAFEDLGEVVETLRVIKSVTFSDTIILFTRDDSDLSLRCLIILVVEIFHKALFKCVPVRAGISHGTFFFNIERSMYSGPALIDAYRTGEAAQWLGVTFSASVETQAKRLGLKTGQSDVVVPWVLALKGGSQRTYAANWPAVFAHDLRISPPISLEQFYQAFEKTFGAFNLLPEDVRFKYQHTVDFMNAFVIRHIGVQKP